MFPKNRYSPSPKQRARTLLASLLLLILLVLAPQPLHAIIFSASSFAELREYISSYEHLDEMLFLVDIDDTLVHCLDTCLAIAHNSKTTGLMNQLSQLSIMAGQSVQNTTPAPQGPPASINWTPFLDIIKQQARRPLIEPASINIIRHLQERGMHVIGCTFMKTGTNPQTGFCHEAWRYNHLANLGFRGSFHEYDFPMAAINNITPLFYHGILFTNAAEKGLVVGSFLTILNWKPRIIFMIDDSLQFLVSVQQMCTARDIPFRGFHYQTHLTAPKPWNMDLATYQFIHLIIHKTWLSDEEAAASINQRATPQTHP